MTNSETTDYLMPYGILKRADVADVVALATKPGPVKLFPVLTVEPEATVADFDAQHPDGADYVIVPAMSRDDDPVALQWIKSQAAKGAVIIGVCAGAKVVGNTGLLDGKRATTHWYSLKELRDRHPAIHYVADRRLVVDRGVATTTGITASMPMSLTLIEAIAGRDKAEAVGRDLGLATWDARHDSGAFQFTRPFALTVMGNTLAFWNKEQLGIELAPGVDEVSLALVADAWSRTYRSRAVTLCRHRRRAADPQRPAHPARAGRHQLARRTTAAGDRGAATGKSTGPGAARNRSPLRNAYRRHGRHAARIPQAWGTALKRACGNVSRFRVPTRSSNPDSSGEQRGVHEQSSAEKPYHACQEPLRSQQ